MPIDNILVAVVSGISTPLLLIIGRWLGRKLNNINSHLEGINGRLDSHDDSWQAQREINAWFAGKIGEPLLVRRQDTKKGWP